MVRTFHDEMQHRGLLQPPAPPSDPVSRTSSRPSSTLPPTAVVINSDSDSDSDDDDDDDGDDSDNDDDSNDGNKSDDRGDSGSEGEDNSDNESSSAGGRVTKKDKKKKARAEKRAKAAAAEAAAAETPADVLHKSLEQLLRKGVVKPGCIVHFQSREVARLNQQLVFVCTDSGLPFPGSFDFASLNGADDTENPLESITVDGFTVKKLLWLAAKIPESVSVGCVVEYTL